MSDAITDAQVIGAFVRAMADKCRRPSTGGGTILTAEMPMSDYVAILRAFEACAEGRHAEALQRLADLNGMSVADMRRCTTREAP